MINYTKLARAEFDIHLINLFGNDQSHRKTIEILRNMAHISFSQFTKSNSIYFTLGHALSASIIGFSLLESMKAQSGTIRESEAINLMTSILFCNIGIVHGVLNEDLGNKCKTSIIDVVDISKCDTSSCLWKFKEYRSKEFIKESPYVSSNTNNEIINGAIEVSDITRPIERISNIPVVSKLVRATQIIALMADENIFRRQVEFYLAGIEGGVLSVLMFKSLGDFRDKFGQYFWETLYPDVGDVLILLRETIVGREIVSNIYSHL